MLRLLLPRFDAVVFAALPMARAEQPERFVADFGPGAVHGAASSFPAGTMSIAESPEAALALARRLAADGQAMRRPILFLIWRTGPIRIPTGLALRRASVGKLLQELSSRCTSDSMADMP